MPNLVMMVGLPYSGKSYYTNNILKWKDYTKISSDEEIIRMAEASGRPYNSVFKDVVCEALQKAEKRFIGALRGSEDILIDQTNLTKASRARKLALVPKEYTKVCVYCPQPCAEELNRRIAERTSHMVPLNVMQAMLEIHQQPTIEEGFDWMYIAGFDDMIIT